MKDFSTPALFAATFLLIASVHGTSTRPSTIAERAQAADAICLGIIGHSSCFRGPDGGIRTQTAVQVNDALKGAFPGTIYLIHHGGVLDGMEERRSDMPSLPAGEARLLFLKARADGTVFVNGAAAGALPIEGIFGNVLATQISSLYPDASQAGVDLRNTAAATGIRQPSVVGGLFLNSGVPFRFTHGDYGEPIGYLVDVDALPPGIDSPTALQVVSNAFQAWEDATSLSFEFRGATSFGMAASQVDLNDGMIRVQMHDSFDAVNGDLLLGFGGSLAFTNSGLGGTIDGQGYGRATRGYLMIEHTNTSLSNSMKLEQVVAHELGHVLGLDHSSEDADEPDAGLREALMYFQISSESVVGAQLAAYDRNLALQPYPTNNTPPVAFNRVLDCVTHVTQLGSPTTPGPAVPGINEVELAAFDRQTTNLSIVLQSVGTSTGEFTVEGAKLKYDAQNFFGEPRLDPFGNSGYNFANVVVSDGTNLSPPVTVFVISLMPDRFPADFSDGLPDDWMTAHFGNANPAQIPGFSVNGDADGDGISNLDEFRIGTDPNDANSALMFLPSTQTNTLNFASISGELYQIEATSDFTNWTPAAVPVQATNNTTVISNFLGDFGDVSFFRLQRVP